MEKKMRIGMNQPLVLLFIQGMAFWPVWRWYFRRFTSPMDDKWYLLPLAAALILLFRESRFSPRPVSRHRTWTRRLALPIILLAVYTISYPILRPLPRAMFAVVTLCCTFSACFPSRRLSPGVYGLFLLALPLIPALQFYCGYPLRVLVGEASALLLRFSGLEVIREGTGLRWSDFLIEVDGPCSGVKMLWAGGFLACIVVSVFMLQLLQTFLVFLGTFIGVLLGNIFRTAALFHVESGLIEFPGWIHDGIGVVVFCFTAVAIAGLAERFRRRKIQCAG